MVADKGRKRQQTIAPGWKMGVLQRFGGWLEGNETYELRRNATCPFKQSLSQRRMEPVFSMYALRS